MTEQVESVDVKLTRLEGKFDALMDKVSDRARDSAEIRREISAQRDDVRREHTGLRQDLERQIMAVTLELERHEVAVNPHPQQEDWLRRHMDRLTVAIDGLKTEIATARGAGKVLWPALMSGIAAAGAVVATKVFGG